MSNITPEVIATAIAFMLATVLLVGGILYEYIRCVQDKEYQKRVDREIKEGIK